MKAGWLLTNAVGVLGCSKDELRSAIITRAYVRYILFTRNKHFGTKLKKPRI